MCVGVEKKKKRGEWRMENGMPFGSTQRHTPHPTRTHAHACAPRQSQKKGRGEDKNRQSWDRANGGEGKTKTGERDGVCVCGGGGWGECRPPALSSGGCEGGLHAGSMRLFPFKGRWDRMGGWGGKGWGRARFDGKGEERAGRRRRPRARVGPRTTFPAQAMPLAIRSTSTLIVQQQHRRTGGGYNVNSRRVSGGRVAPGGKRTEGRI